MSTGLRYSEKGHRYWLDGRPTPGVTTILGKGLPKPGLMYWSAKSVAEYVIRNQDDVDRLRLMGDGPAIAALKQIPWQARDEAAVRGTEVHALGAEVVNGHEVDVPEHLTSYVQGYVDLIDELGIEPVLTERPVASRKWQYCGTFDLIAKVGGETLLLDLKTSKTIYGSVACQVAAYANAEWYVGDDDPETPMPAVDGIGAIHVTDAGSTLHRFPDMEAAWKAFLHIQWVAKQVPIIDGWGAA
jgi:hypothetical protein